ncbi:MAG: hypothetical protein JWM68_4652 [Verrucomicrobiales bacterium]|nr:hypothetical protein [Verrucomicrobiales bacterium]
MPPISEQWSLAGSVTNPDLVSARFLLRQGRPFEAAVKAFSPYTNVKEVNEEARMAAVALIQARKTNPRGKTLIFVNNRLEGNALDTIAAIVGLAEN